MKYTLTVDDKQAATILRALDFYSRIGCGQFKDLSQLFAFDSRKCLDIDWKAVERLLVKLKRKLLPLGKDASYSVGNREVPQDYRMAYDILQVLRYCKAWHENPKGGSLVSFYPPLLVSDHESCYVVAQDTCKQLEDLRFAVAQVAQAAGIQTEECPVRDKEVTGLSQLVTQDTGWLELADKIRKQIGEWDYTFDLVEDSDVT